MCRHTVLEQYLFKGVEGGMLVALGIGSLFNHSRTPNLDYRVNKVDKIITFMAARDISTGEELTFYYGSALWFEEVGLQDDRGQSTVHEHMDDADAFLGALAL